MTFRHILLVLHPAQPQAAITGKRLADYLRGRGVQAEIVNDYRLIAQFPQADLCISLGGDGTALRCARACAPTQLPVLAVNCGSLGFLSACEEEQAEACLEQILQGNFQISSRLLLEADLERAGQTLLRGLPAFNDCLIKTLQPRAFRLDAQCNGRDLKSYYGDGVIISTPAGSTAYSLAAGGPIVEPDLDVMLVTPVCPHSLTERPLILDAKTELTFIPRFTNADDRAAFSLDGQNSHELQNGDRVILRRGPHRARLVCPNTFDFFSRLRQKLEWGGRAC